MRRKPLMRAAPGNTCAANPLYTFGDSAQACVQDMPNSDGFFNFTNVYTCGGEGSAGWDASRGACVFTPRVYVQDNWEWCPGYNGLGRWGSDCAVGETINENAWLLSNINSLLPRSDSAPLQIVVLPKS